MNKQYGFLLLILPIAWMHSAPQKLPEKLEQIANESWQKKANRLLIISSSFEKNNSLKTNEKKQYRALILNALHNDKALLVRDTAVESIRRILKMNPQEAPQWKSELEKAFFDKKNTVNKSGLFIRETILRTFFEAAWEPSVAMMNSMKKDTNPRIFSQQELWKTTSF